MESEHDDPDNVMYLYVTENGTLVTTDGEHVLDEDETVSNSEETIGVDTEENQEQVLIIEVDENNQNYMAVSTPEITTPASNDVDFREEIDNNVEKCEDQTQILPVTNRSQLAPPRTITIKSPPSSSVIIVPERTQLKKCRKNCGCQFIHAEALVRHENICDFSDKTKNHPLSDFEKLSDEIITYFEVICEKGSRNTVKRKHKWLWQFLKELLNDPIEFCCSWIDRSEGRFKILDKSLCTAKWENYKLVKKMSTVGYGKQEFDACFEWYHKIKILKKLSEEKEEILRFQFHPTFYSEFFEPYRFLTSIPREMVKIGKFLVTPKERPKPEKTKASPMYCSKNCGSQYIKLSALENHEKVCCGKIPSSSSEEKDSPEKCEKSTDGSKKDNTDKNLVDFAIVYPTNNKNVVMCSLCRKFWNTTGLRIHMKKAHNLSKIKIQKMDISSSSSKQVTVRFDKVGEVTM